MTDTPTVLFVDDEPALADGYATKFSEYDTLSAYDGEAALEALDETVDVVVLDRRMPGTSGEEVLEAIRERDHDCRVVMLTGVEPDVDVVEMGFDEYLVKPVEESALRETVERLTPASLDDFEDPLLDALSDPKARRCCAALLEESLNAQELADETEYSLTTVYRRLNTLQQAGLIDSERTVEPDGDHYQTFTAVPTRVRIDIDDGVQVAVEHPDPSTV